MKLLAIDPGTTESAFVLLDDLTILHSDKLPNGDLLERLRDMEFDHPAVCEMVQSFGMPVGKEVFETVFWIGRFAEACECQFRTFHRITRTEVKMHLCGTARAKDGNIRQALIDKLGPQGTKKAPGPTYGISADRWSALAVGVTWLETAGPLRPTSSSGSGPAQQSRANRS